MEKQRIIYLDYLRAIATVSVIILHVAATGWLSYDITSIEWNAINIYDSIVRWTVPVFLMISGALFLKKDVSIKDLYIKYIPKMATVYMFWSAFYVFVEFFLFDPGYPISTPLIINRFIEGHFHLWYIP